MAIHSVPLPRVRRRAGITRVARLTGLDRTGVEVATAIRPQGYVLQVSNGKGETWEEAARGAILEAAELHASERPPDGPGPLCEVLATDLYSGEPRAVAAQAVYCPAPDARALGGPAARWTSNGMGAHPDRDAALLHALLEAAERDQLARALPRCWTRSAVAHRMLDRTTLAGIGPSTARLAARIEAGGFEVFLFDLTPTGRSLGLPVAGALIFDRQLGTIPVAAGYACALGPDDALRSALLEAAQSRLTDIHGAREDVTPMDRHAADLLSSFCRSVKPRRRASQFPDSRPRRSGARAALDTVLDRLHRAGVSQVAAVDLGSSALGVHVLKVLVPGFLLSELL